MLRRATLRVLTSSGTLAGTAFSATEGGKVLTCHHVVAGDGVLEMDDVEGQRWRGRRCSEDESLHRADLAIVQLEACDRPFPPPLPLFAATDEALSVRSRAWLADSASFRDPIALSGQLRGPASIAYRARGDYRVVGQAIGGFAVEPGMSGAALWSDRYQAAIGVLAVSAEDARNVSGFAILLAEAAGSPDLATLLEANGACVARGGALPNDIGLRRLLETASAATLRRLEDRQIVLPEKFVARAGAREALEAFIASDRTAFPIVSVAAHGKTSLMAQLASDDSLPPTWLVRGADLQRGRPGEALDRLLGEAGVPDPASFTRLAGQCRNRPLLLLDGLNEVPIPAVEMAREWLPDLIAAVRQAGWKLVFTTRPELFGFLHELKQHFFEPPSADGGRSHFVLGEYSADEALEAVQNYGVKKAISRNIGRHPMMVRLAHEAGADADRRSRVLKRFLDRSLLVIRAAIPLHPSEIVRRLIELADRTEAEAGILPFDDRIVRGQEELVAILSRENILEEVAGGYRFVFDEIRDYLLAAGLASRIEGSRRIPDLSGISYPADVVAVCIELLDDGPGRRIGQAWAERIATSWTTKEERRLAFAIVAALPRTPQFDEVKRKHVQAILPAISRSDFIRERDLSVAFPPDAFDSLLKRAIEQENGYGWREKDIWSNWHRGGTEASARMKFGAPRLVIELLDDEERDGAETLIHLLDDSTQLRGGEASVGSFALVMLLSHRGKIGLERIFEEVVLEEKSGADSLVEALAEEEPATLTDLLEAVPPDVQVRRFMAIRNGWRSLLRAEANQGDDPLRSRATAALTALAGHLAELELQEVLLLAAAHKLPVAIAIPEAIERIGLAGVLHPSTLVAAVQMGWLSLEDARQSSRQASIERDFIGTIAATWHPAGAIGLDRIVSLVEDSFRTRDKDGEAAHPLEMIAWRAGLAEAKSSGLLDLIERFVREGWERTVHGLVYPAVAQEEMEGDQAPFRAWLFELLVRSALSSDVRETMIFSLSKEPGRIRRNEKWIAEISRGIPAPYLLHTIALASSAALREDHLTLLRAAAADEARPAAERSLLDRAAKMLADTRLTGLALMQALFALNED